ncbi:MAG TPA: rhodanese-like domain-containing protein [Rhodospirillales bacterium]|nr:rhodanese-like domain-containing protein [Rhodospirillales bacterium]
MINFTKFLHTTFVVALVGILSACSCQTQNVHPSITNLSSSEFNERIKNDGILIDVRTPSEFNEGHLENAMAMDYYDDAFEKMAIELPKDKDVYVYCRSGRRSSSASIILLEQGHPQVYNLIGGINAWQTSGLPVFQKIK